MPLTKEQAGHIALMALQAIKAEQGITLKPKETRRDVHNMARQLGISVPDAAQFVKDLIRNLYQEVDKELDKMIKGE